MKRILFSAMEQRDGRYWYQGEPYTGVGFTLHPEQRVTAHEVKDGVVAGPYRPICVPDDGVDYEQINDTEGLLDDYVTKTYRGKAFTGIMYSFLGETCNRESFTRNGVLDNDACWYANGNMQIFVPPNDHFSEWLSMVPLR